MLHAKHLALTHPVNEGVLGLVVTEANHCLLLQECAYQGTVAPSASLPVGDASRGDNVNVDGLLLLSYSTHTSEGSGTLLVNDGQRSAAQTSMQETG
jgi:RNase P/RNase MRP subunit p29